jgi:hypothetical protein
MSIQSVLLPLFVQVVLTFVLGFLMARLNRQAVLRGDVKLRDVALREPNWPARNLQFRNAFQNQLETPVLFYVLTILAWITRHADVLFVVMAWIYVLLRIAHAYVHVTENYMPRRGAIFIAGVVLLALMWAIFIIRILLGLG